MSFSIIAAIARNNVIGKNNKLPWRIPEELEHFYNLVSGKPVILGRKTYESIGKPIKNSRNIVLSHNPSLRLPGCEMVNSLDEVLNLDSDNIEFMVAGGESVYRQFLPFVDKMYLTLIDHEFAGDAYFPKWKKDDWQVIGENIIKTSSHPCRFFIFQRK